jgi:hypothetical protein
MAEHTWWETIEAKSDEVVDKVKHIIAEGNVRRVRIQHKGQTIAEFPLTLGVVGALIAPMLAAIAAISAMVTDCTVEVEKAEKPVATGAPDPTERK